MTQVVLTPTETTFSDDVADAFDPTFKYNMEDKNGAPLIAMRNLCLDGLRDPNAVANISLIVNTWYRKSQNGQIQNRFPIMWEFGGGDPTVSRKGLCAVIGARNGGRVRGDRLAHMNYNTKPNHNTAAVPATPGTLFAIGFRNQSAYAILIYRIVDAVKIPEDVLANYTVGEGREYAGINATLVGVELRQAFSTKPMQWYDSDTASSSDLTALKNAAYEKLLSPQYTASYVESFFPVTPRETQKGRYTFADLESDEIATVIAEPDEFLASVKKVSAEHRRWLASISAPDARYPLAGHAAYTLLEDESVVISYGINPWVATDDDSNSFSPVMVTTVLPAGSNIPAELIALEGSLVFRCATVDELAEVIKSHEEVASVDNNGLQITRAFLTHA